LGDTNIKECGIKSIPMPLFHGIDEVITHIIRRLANLLFPELSQSIPFDSTVYVCTGPDISRGDLVTFDGPAGIRRARVGDEVIGVATGDGYVRVGPLEGSAVSMAYDPSCYENMMDSGAYAASIARRGVGFPTVRGRGNTYQYTAFPEHVEQKAWDLLKKYMTAEQYFAFMEGSTIELENQLEDCRLLINKSGDFTILQGPRGAAITQASGRIHSYKYPLGDEIAAFLDWFNHRTKDLISNWQCGTYGIKKEG